jgi:hypothetical protein
MTGFLSDYTNLITSEHKNKPNFMASVVAAVQPFVDIQDCLNIINASFDIDEAIGAQLDVIGEWLGLSRDLQIPITNLFFSWDTIDLGWDEGIWYYTYEVTTNTVALSDDIYRAALKLRAAYCGFDGTVGALQSLLADQFGQLFPELSLVAIDGYDMSLTYQLYGQKLFGKYTLNGLTPIIQELFLQSFLTLKPATISVNLLIWNGTAFTASEIVFNFILNYGGPTLFTFPPGQAAPWVSSFAFSGTILPTISAPGLRFQLGTSPIIPPASLADNPAINGYGPPTAGESWYAPTISNSSMGSFSGTLPVAISAYGTYYIWAYDPVTGQTVVSAPIIVEQSA